MIIISIIPRPVANMAPPMPSAIVNTAMNANEIFFNMAVILLWSLDRTISCCLEDWSAMTEVPLNSLLSNFTFSSRYRELSANEFDYGYALIRGPPLATQGPLPSILRLCAGTLPLGPLGASSLPLPALLKPPAPRVVPSCRG
jgi:hypothetical protein